MTRSFADAGDTSSPRRSIRWALHARSGSKEHLGGFILVDAADMNEALDLAAGIPLAKLGSIEVRPVMTIGG
jgi:hypothetical protein